MSDRGEYSQLPPRVDVDDTVVEIDPYEAVEPIRGVRRVSPYSPVAGIDEARLYAEVATDGRTNPWRRRLARGVVLATLGSVVFSLIYSVIARWRL